MVARNVFRVSLGGLAVAGLLAFASAAQAQSRAGSSVRRGNHVAVARSVRSSGGGSFRYVHSSLGRLPGGGSHGLSSSSSNRSAHTRSALSRAANSLKSQQHRSGAGGSTGTSGTSGASGTGGTAGSGASGTSGDPFAAVDASAGTHHRSRKDKATSSSSSGATAGTTTSGTTTAGTTSGAAASGGKKCAAKTSSTATSGTTTGTTAGTTTGATTGTTTGTTAGTTTLGLMANQGLGNNGTLQKAFMVKFSYTPNDQNSHNVVVNASSREEAKEKVLARHPHAVFRSIVRI